MEAAIDAGAELKVRDGEEVMQAGDMFISDLSTLGEQFLTGVMSEIGGGFITTPVIGSLQVSVAAGAANMWGRMFRTHTPRVLNIAPNPSLATRIDTVYLEQIYDESSADNGKQTIAIAQGTVSGTPATVPVTTGVARLPIARVTIPQGGTSVTVDTSVIVHSTPRTISLGADSIGLVTLKNEVKNLLTDAMFTVTSPVSGQTLAYNGSDWVNEDNVISLAEDVAIASPASGQVLTYSSGKWRNVALPAYPSVSIAGSSDAVISSPQERQFLTYSAGKWRNSTLTIDIPSSKFAQTVYSAYGNLPGNNTLLASCAVTVPPGTWLLKVEAMGQYYGINVGGGSNNFWFQGDAVSGLGLENTQVVATSDQGVDRSWYNTCGRVVTVTSTTMFTADLWVSGGNIFLRGGKIVLMAV